MRGASVAAKPDVPQGPVKQEPGQIKAEIKTEVKSEAGASELSHAASAVLVGHGVKVEKPPPYHSVKDELLKEEVKTEQESVRPVDKAAF